MPKLVRGRLPSDPWAVENRQSIEDRLTRMVVLPALVEKVLRHPFLHWRMSCGVMVSMMRGLHWRACNSRASALIGLRFPGC